MNSKKGLLGYYNYTVILTYIGCVFGLVGISNVMAFNYHNAILCLMLAGLCDMFDGAVASTKKRDANEKCFGIQIDSLSDLICFGVLSGLFTYNISGRTDIGFMISCVYILCALIRLAYFNVDEMDRQSQTTEPRKYYYGMPVTLSALILPAFYELSSNFGWEMKHSALVVLGAMACAFLLPFRLTKPKFIGKICVVIFGLGELLLLVTGVDL